MHPSTESGSLAFQFLLLTILHIFNPCNGLLSTLYSLSSSKAPFLEGIVLSRTLLIKTSYPSMQQIQALNEDLACAGNVERPWGVSSLTAMNTNPGCPFCLCFSFIVNYVSLACQLLIFSRKKHTQYSDDYLCKCNQSSEELTSECARNLCIPPPSGTAKHSQLHKQQLHMMGGDSGHS